ncbi:MAG: XRE family transcriptional regulator [Candidatus Marinimicrobia bacterium]|nr:XRE family transcriptional regulator [Candidatus Neomarinimicrobiota bacterium]
MKKADSAPVGHFDFGVMRTLRREQGWTIAQLGERANVSTAVISKLERNRSAVELDTLQRLARAFEMSVTELVGLAERRLTHHTRARTHHAGEFAFERITYANVSCLAGHAPGGATLNRSEVHRDDLEICWVRSGRLRLTLADEALDLAGGEAVQFDAVFPHRYEALTACDLVLIHARKETRY